MSRPSHVVVFDFDGTLLPKAYHSLFDVMDVALSPIDRKEIEETRQSYLLKFHSHQLTPEEDEMFYIKVSEIYIKANLTIAKAKAVFSDIKLRSGVLETLSFLKEQQVPTAIISYSYLQWINLVCEQNEVKHLISKVYGANFIVENGLIYGYRPETFVFRHNKGLLSQAFAEEHGIPYENILAVGDSIADYRLGHLKENRLGIAESESEKEKIREFFGEVAVTHSFYPVKDWLIRKLYPWPPKK